MNTNTNYRLFEENIILAKTKHMPTKLLDSIDLY